MALLTVGISYPTIQECVTNASPGDKILIMQGVYSESVFIIYKDNLEFLTSGSVRIAPGLFSGTCGDSFMIYASTDIQFRTPITCSDVYPYQSGYVSGSPTTGSNWGVQKGEQYFYGLDRKCGFNIVDSSQIAIDNCYTFNCDTGIMLLSSSLVTINYASASYCGRAGIEIANSNSSTIRSASCKNNGVETNPVYSQKDTGISYYNSSNIDIVGCKSFDNGDYAIDGSKGNNGNPSYYITIDGNSFSATGSPVKISTQDRCNYTHTYKSNKLHNALNTNGYYTKIYTNSASLGYNSFPLQFQYSEFFRYLQNLNGNSIGNTTLSAWS